MTHDDEKRRKNLERGGRGPQDRGDPEDGRVKQPDPEEVPELLGERSDYPMPFGPDRER